MKKKLSVKIQKKVKEESSAVFVKTLFWFLMGIFLGIFFISSLIYVLFQKNYADKVYPGISINGVNFSGKTEKQVNDFFVQKNHKIEQTKFIFSIPNTVSYDGPHTITITAGELNFGYDAKLLSQQAISIGRSKDYISNLSIILQAYVNSLNLPPSYHYSEKELETKLLSISEKIYRAPTEALFSFENGRVAVFRPSLDGQEIDIEEIKSQIHAKTLSIVSSDKVLTIMLTIPVKVLAPKITTDKANNLGIKELLSSGTSLFQHSIPERIHNVTLAAGKFNGILVMPNEEFSFNKILGDVSNKTGYKQAYVIQNGRTVLGDGGGVCQVSTTLFRALLNAGLPITERHAHAYRVGYYEQDSGPGLDATVYSPSPDLKFKNTTDNHILIQTFTDLNSLKLTFLLYGTKDNREVTISKPVISSQSSPPEDLYQDDPTLQKGIVKQVDFSAWGANVYFTREVKKNGSVIINEKFVSNYRPWQAIYLRGTRE